MRTDHKGLLVIAAHPDDEVLGCGGTIARHARKGLPIRVVFLAEGVTARFAEDELTQKDVKAASLKRNGDALRALKTLGVPNDAVFLGERYCCRLDTIPMIDLVKEIEGHIRAMKPGRILFHSESDVNIDHRLAYEAVLSAARPVWPWPIDLLTFEVLSSTEWNYEKAFAPTTFVDIGEFIDMKIAALIAYEDEVRPPPHPRSEAVLSALATFRGAQAGVRFAEAFKTVRRLEY